jgi:thermostable 8-oxoguanine DNA glycosylase
MSTAELEWRLIYAVIVAGKSARFTEGAMRRLALTSDRSPFRNVQQWITYNQLENVLKEARTGNYTKLAKCLRELVYKNLNLSTCTPQDLETIHGIGPKTSRFFILWTRPDARYAALDVHVLRWMNKLGYDAPRTTPSGDKYAKLEKLFLEEADKRGLTPGELDAQIWDQGANGAAALQPQLL